MAISQYDQPAQSNLINTYVPVPFQEILQAGIARQGRYDDTLQALQANQEYLDQLQAIEGTIQEDYLNQSRQKIQDIASQYANKDLSNAYIRRQLRDDVRRNINPATISNIIQSKKNYDAAQKMKAELDARGLYFEPYDRTQDPAITGSLGINDLYQYTPRAFQDPDELIINRFKSLPVAESSTVEGNQIFRRQSNEAAISQTMNETVRNIKDSPQGEWIIRQAKANGTYTGDDNETVQRYIESLRPEYTINNKIHQGFVPEYMLKGNDKQPDIPFNASNNTQSLPNPNLTPPKEVKKQIGINPEKVKGMEDLLKSGNFDDQGNYIRKTVEGLTGVKAELYRASEILKGEDKAKEDRQQKYDAEYNRNKQLINKIKLFNSGQLKGVSDVEALDAYVKAYNDIKNSDYNTYLYETDEVSTSARERITRQVSADLAGRNIVIAETGKDALQPANTFEELLDQYGVTKTEKDDVYKSLKITSIVPALGGYQASVVIGGQPRNFLISPNKREQALTSLMVDATKKHLDGDVGLKEFTSNGRKFAVVTRLEYDPEKQDYFFTSNLMSRDGNPIDPYLGVNNIALDKYEQHVARLLQIQ